MERLIPVTLISGKVIEVLPREVEGLKAAGKLLKEHKPQDGEITKDRPLSSEEQQAANERMKPTKKGPANISSKNMGRPKKT